MQTHRNGKLGLAGRFALVQAREKPTVQASTSSSSCIHHKSGDATAIPSAKTAVPSAPLPTVDDVCAAAAKQSQELVRTGAAVTHDQEARVCRND